MSRCLVSFLALCALPLLVLCRDCSDQYNDFDGVCAVKLDAYAPNWNYYEAHLDVTCESVEDPSALNWLPDCRVEVQADKDRGPGYFWNGIGSYDFVHFNDAYGPYQVSEWNTWNSNGWYDKTYPSKISGGGCDEADGHCRKKRRCTLVVWLQGWVNEIGGDEKMHDWPAALGVEQVVPWYNRRVTGYEKYRKEVANCVICQVVPCPALSAVCPNGRVYGRPVETVAGAMVKRPVCSKQCSSGTFLTCMTNDGCVYRPLTDQETSGDGSGYRLWYEENLKIQTNLNVVPVGILAPPVYDCYPCKYADKRTHVGVAVMTDTIQAKKGFLAFWCPGGSRSPEDCPANMVTKVDDATGMTSACGCKGGMIYDSNARECRPCKAGHFCAWSGMSPPAEVECPLDYYAESGWEACKKCDTRRQCDSGQALTRCLPGSASGRSGVYQQHDSECVNCAECQQLSGLSESVPCYKVSPIVGFA